MTSLGWGFAVGHWTHEDARTGCTVVLPPHGNVASCEIRGSAPSSREVEHLHPDRKLTEVHALLLTGGSAFGLAAAEGVVEWLEARGIGYSTPLGPVPIVPAAVIFDLGAGDPKIRPGRDGGRAACDAARDGDIPTGRVGAGTGATVGKWAGFEHASPGGLGIAAAERDGSRVAALAVANSVGDVIGADGSVLAGTRSPRPTLRTPRAAGGAPTNTVLAVVATEGLVDKRDVRFIAARGADGITVSVRPAHTRYDGDVVFAVSAPPPPATERPAANLDLLGHLATEAVAAAVRAAVAPPR